MGQGPLYPTGEKLPSVDIPGKFTVKEMMQVLEKFQAQKYTNLPNMYPTQSFLKEHHDIVEPYKWLINFYKGAGHRDVNTFYKTGQVNMGLGIDFDKAADNIRVLFKLDKRPPQAEFWPLFAQAMNDLYKKVKPLPNDIIIYRGITMGTIAQNFFDGSCIKSANYPAGASHRYCKPTELIDLRYFKDYTEIDDVRDYVYETLGFVSTGTKFATAVSFACKGGLPKCDTVLAMRMPAGSKFIMPLLRSIDEKGNISYSDYEYEFILFPLHNTFIIDQVLILNLYEEHGDTNSPVNIYLGSYCNELNKHRPQGFPKQRGIYVKPQSKYAPLVQVPFEKCTAEKITKCNEIGKICKPSTGNCVQPTMANKILAGLVLLPQKPSGKCTAETITKCAENNKICKPTTGNCVLPTKANKLNAGIIQKATMPSSHKIVLKPFLIKDGHEFIFDLDVGNETSNEILKTRISQDYTNVRNIVNLIYNSEKDYEASLIVTNYDYDGKYIYLTVQKQDGSPFTMNDYSAIIKTVDPYNTGPDTWMEGNIDILRGNELRNTKYADQSVLELGVIVKE